MSSFCLFANHNSSLKWNVLHFDKTYTHLCVPISICIVVFFFKPFLMLNFFDAFKLSIWKVRRKKKSLASVYVWSNFFLCSRLSHAQDIPLPFIFYFYPQHHAWERTDQSYMPAWGQSVWPLARYRPLLNAYMTTNAMVVHPITFYCFNPITVISI